MFAEERRRNSRSNRRGDEEAQERAEVSLRTRFKDVDARDAAEPSVDFTTPGPPVRVAGTECAGSAVSSGGPTEQTTRGNNKELTGFVLFATRSREFNYLLRYNKVHYG